MPNNNSDTRFFKLCETFIERTDKVVAMQMDLAHKAGRMRLAVSGIFLEAASNFAQAMSKPELANAYRQKLADQIAGFILQDEYADTIFDRAFDERGESLAKEARSRGLNNLAEALEI